MLSAISHAAFWCLNEGSHHQVSYRGLISYSVEAHTGDEEYPTIYTDITVDAISASALYSEDNGETMRVILDLSDMENYWGMFMPPGTQVSLDMLMPYDENGTIAPGTYRVSDNLEQFTLYPGGEWGGLRHHI